MMKIIYLIYVAGHGRGGHFYSLLETATQVGKQAEVTVVSIGVARSPVLEKFNGKYFHIKDQGIFSTSKTLFRLVGEGEFTIIHAFDARVFLYARLASIKNNLPLLLTKCGGSNPKKYFPFHSHIVLFSQENKEYFTKKNKFKITKFPIVANRVDINKEMQDQVRINELKQILIPDVPVILRINRIGSTYKKSIIQSINLVQKLNEIGTDIQLLVIGALEDNDVLEELRKSAGKNIKIIIDDRYTVNASQLIDVADVVVGTGRGFMEAALLGKIILSPNENLNLPVLASRDRVEDIFSMNFSQRYRANISNSQAFDEIRNLLLNLDSQKENIDIESFAIEHFSSGNLYKKYEPIYKDAQSAHLYFFDLFVHWFYSTGIISKIKNLFRK